MQDIDEMIDFFLYEKGEYIKINGVDQIGIIMDAVDKLTYYDDKIIRCKCQIKTGDIVEYNNLKYIIISQIDKEENSFKARIRKCSYRIAFNWSGNIKWFDCIEESKVFDVSTGTYISVASGNIYITVQYNADTRNIALNNRFYVTNQPFKITGIDKSQEGLIKFNCALDSISTSYDDVENNIADRWRYETGHTYTLTINNGDTANVLVKNVFQLNVSATDNGSAIANPVITYTSSDPNVVSVDNTGKVMGISLGQALITAKLTYHDTISDSITITSVETLTHSYTISISGSSTIKIGQSQSYVAHIYDNGAEVFDKSVVWSVRNQDGTTSPAYSTITASTGNSATIKANSSSTYINRYTVLKATLSDDSTVFKEFSVQLKSLF
ncbi:MAG: Bacterial Ig-like domain (group 2) [Firmicutes bacterium ADurb.Bin419]|nr:MAG: Bacterial Ig-like domain (group 2) [Firmicutes bacterium ADurb.Bin419]